MLVVTVLSGMTFEPGIKRDIQPPRRRRTLLILVDPYGLTSRRRLNF